MTTMAAITLTMGMTACADNAAEDTAATAEAGSLAGTWVIDVDSATAENDNSKISLVDGEFTCESCIPQFTVTADGEWQPSDSPGVDDRMVEIVDEFTIKTSGREDGEVFGTSTWTVSEDGQSMTQSFVNLDGEETVEGSRTFTRVGDATEGAHAITGDWQPGAFSGVSDAALTFTYAVDGDTVTLTNNEGGYTATLGGEPVQMVNDTTGGMITVEQLSDNTYAETYTRDGEVTNRTEMTVSGDTLTAVSTDPRDGSIFNYSATRQ